LIHLSQNPVSFTRTAVTVLLDRMVESENLPVEWFTLRLMSCCITLRTYLSMSFDFGSILRHFSSRLTR
jgi:hypothetical protein